MKVIRRTKMKQWVTKLTNGSEKGTMLDLFGEPIVIKQKKNYNMRLNVQKKLYLRL